MAGIRRCFNAEAQRRRDAEYDAKGRLVRVEETGKPVETSNCKFQMKFSCVVQVRKTHDYISRQVRQVREVVF